MHTASCNVSVLCPRCHQQFDVAFTELRSPIGKHVNSKTGAACAGSSSAPETLVCSPKPGYQIFRSIAEWLDEITAGDNGVTRRFVLTAD